MQQLASMRTLEGNLAGCDWLVCMCRTVLGLGLGVGVVGVLLAKIMCVLYFSPPKETFSLCCGLNFFTF